MADVLSLPPSSSWSVGAKVGSGVGIVVGVVDVTLVVGNSQDGRGWNRGLVFVGMLRERFAFACSNGASGHAKIA